MGLVYNFCATNIYKLDFIPVTSMGRKFASVKRKEKRIGLRRIKILIGIAGKVCHNEPDLAKRYVYLARKISQRLKIRIPGEYKRRFCKKCNSPLLPGYNCRVRLTGKTVTYYCKDCKNFKRIGYG